MRVLAGGVTFQLLDMLVQFIEMLSLLSELLFQLPQAVETLYQSTWSLITISSRVGGYLSISFSLMNFVSLACSRLVQLSLLQAKSDMSAMCPMHHKTVSFCLLWIHSSSCPYPWELPPDLIPPVSPSAARIAEMEKDRRIERAAEALGSLRICVRSILSAGFVVDQGGCTE